MNPLYGASAMPASLHTPHPTRQRFSLGQTVRWGVLGLLGLAACAKPPPVQGPEGSYRLFAEAVRRGDAQAAWGSLSDRTRAQATARAKTISEASHGLIKNEPALMLLQTGTKPGPVGEVSVLVTDGGTAMLEVGPESRRTRVQMVYEASHWTVDLFDTLQENP